MLGDLFQYLTIHNPLYELFGTPGHPDNMLSLATLTAFILGVAALVALHKRRLAGIPLTAGALGAIAAIVGYSFGPDAGRFPFRAALVCAVLALITAGWRAWRQDKLTAKLTSITTCIMLAIVFGALANGLTPYVGFNVGFIASGYEAEWWLAIFLSLCVLVILALVHVLVRSGWLNPYHWTTRSTRRKTNHNQFKQPELDATLPRSQEEVSALELGRSDQIAQPQPTDQGHITLTYPPQGTQS